MPSKIVSKTIVATFLFMLVDVLLASQCPAMRVGDCGISEPTSGGIRWEGHTIDTNFCTSRYEVRNGKGYVCEYGGDDRYVRFCYSRAPNAECTLP